MMHGLLLLYSRHDFVHGDWPVTLKRGVADQAKRSIVGKRRRCRRSRFNALNKVGAAAAGSSRRWRRKSNAVLWAMRKSQPSIFDTALIPEVPVRALVRHRAKAGALQGLRHVQIVEGDMERAETLGSALEGISRVLLISSSNPQMLEIQCRFIGTCKGSGVAHVV
jgi:hypothetical protein